MARDVAIDRSDQAELAAQLSDLLSAAVHSDECRVRQNGSYLSQDDKPVWTYEITDRGVPSLDSETQHDLSAQIERHRLDDERERYAVEYRITGDTDALGILNDHWYGVLDHLERNPYLDAPEIRRTEDGLAIAGEPAQTLRST